MFVILFICTRWWQHGWLVPSRTWEPGQGWGKDARTPLGMSWTEPPLLNQTTKKLVEQTYISTPFHHFKLNVNSSKECQDYNIVGCIRVVMVRFLTLTLLDFENTLLELWQWNLWILCIFHFSVSISHQTEGTKRNEIKCDMVSHIKRGKQTPVRNSWVTLIAQETSIYFKLFYLFFPLFCFFTWVNISEMPCWSSPSCDLK